MKKTLVIVSTLLVLVVAVIGISTINTTASNYTSDKCFNIEQTSYQVNGNDFLPTGTDCELINTNDKTSVVYSNSIFDTNETIISNDTNNENVDGCERLTSNSNADEAYFQIPFDANDTDNLSVSFEIKLLNNDLYNRVWFTTDRISRLYGPDEIDNICIETAYRDGNNQAFLTTYNYVSQLPIT